MIVSRTTILVLPRFSSFIRYLLHVASSEHDDHRPRERNLHHPIGMSLERIKAGLSAAPEVIPGPCVGASRRVAA